MKIVYLHGFASAGHGNKYDALVKAFGAGNIVAPDLQVDPDKVESIVDQIVHENDRFPLIFVGTSLGGFWANYFSQKWDAPCILINPATSPSVTLAPAVGVTIKNFTTGEPVTVLNEDLKKFATREQFVSKFSNGALIHLFLAKDDAVISFSETLSNIQYYKSCFITEDGGHRYETYFPLVIDKVKEIINNIKGYQHVN